MSDQGVQDIEKLLRKIEYLESQIQQLQAEAEALRNKHRLAEHTGVELKMDSLNRLTHGIAHDINNLLTPIVACSHLIKEDRTASPSVIENAEQLIETSERIIGVSKKLHSLYPKAAKRFQSTDLNAQVKAAVDAVKPQMGDAVTLVVDLDPAAGLVQADTGAIEKIVHELCINARDALTGGGAVTVKTSRGRIAGADTPEEFAVLTVRDQGVGMKPEMRAHIYEPYFTTKEPTRGRGFGLAMVYGNVMRCAATIHCDSEPGKGTEFRIYFRKA
ncbi:MAG: ATP-binding protein [bacterium]